MTAASSASDRPVSAIRASTLMPVSRPSPVVAWSSRTVWPLCSPPSANPPARIASST
jgi:hypothetical protein